jgi:hypothetical protein
VFDCDGVAQIYTFPQRKFSINNFQAHVYRFMIVVFGVWLDKSHATFIPVFS